LIDRDGLDFPQTSGRGPLLGLSPIASKGLGPLQAERSGSICAHPNVATQGDYHGQRRVHGSDGRSGEAILLQGGCGRIDAKPGLSGFAEPCLTAQPRRL
jgi:hypothetical protein